MAVTTDSLFPDLEPQFLTRIYFGLGDNGQVKIGLTKRPSERRGGEMHFTELCSVPGGHLTERMYHNRYAAVRDRQNRVVPAIRPHAHGPVTPCVSSRSST